MKKKNTCNDYSLNVLQLIIKVKETIEHHLYELFKCDNITVDTVEYECSNCNMIIFKANLRAYRAMEKVEKFYSYLKEERLTLFNDDVVVEQYFGEPPQLMYVYIAVAVICLVLVSLVSAVIFIIAVKRCRRRSPK